MLRYLESNLYRTSLVVSILKHSPVLPAIWAPTSQTGLCSVFLRTLLLHPGYLFLELTTPGVRRVVVTSRLPCRWVQAKQPGFASTVQAKNSTVRGQKIREASRSVMTVSFATLTLLSKRYSVSGETLTSTKTLGGREERREEADHV